MLGVGVKRGRFGVAECLTGHGAAVIQHLHHHPHWTGNSKAYLLGQAHNLVHHQHHPIKP
jgi:hypothetical protein